MHVCAGHWRLRRHPRERVRGDAVDREPLRPLRDCLSRERADLQRRVVYDHMCRHDLRFILYEYRNGCVQLWNVRHALHRRTSLLWLSVWLRGGDGGLRCKHFERMRNRTDERVELRCVRAGMRSEPDVRRHAELRMFVRVWRLRWKPGEWLRDELAVFRHELRCVQTSVSDELDVRRRIVRLRVGHAGLRSQRGTELPAVLLERGLQRRSGMHDGRLRPLGDVRERCMQSRFTVLRKLRLPAMLHRRRLRSDRVLRIRRVCLGLPRAADELRRCVCGHAVQSPALWRLRNDLPGVGGGVLCGFVQNAMRVNRLTM